MKSMNIFKRVLFVLFTLFLSSFVFNGCGYKPTNYYAKKELSGKVFVKLFVDLKDPKNSVFIKDYMNKIIVQKLGSKLVFDESLADTVLYLKINSVNMQTLQYDKDGYNKLYKAVVNILVSYNKKDEAIKRSFIVTGEHNFSVDSGTIVTEINDSLRFDAIKNASDDALEEVLANIAVYSFK